MSGVPRYSEITNHNRISLEQCLTAANAPRSQKVGKKSSEFIKSSRSGKYLGIEGSPNNGTAVVVVSNPFKWNVKDSDVESAKGIRILVHGTNFSLDLSYGNSANHTKIQLWSSWPGANQIWALTERVSIEDRHTYSLRNRQEGTAVELSGDDNHSIIRYYLHGGILDPL
ncbi:hypothetical protein BDR03DRAFT_982327 [Suillus americanus]|nr:hypothetical protein BDR03DRAFT_982327 [Suillus americanus]